MKKTPFISKKLLLAALLLPLGFANAQTKPNPLLEAPEPIPKWELSVDLMPLLGRGSADGVGYILRKYTKHNTAFRFKLSPSIFISFPSNSSSLNIPTHRVYVGYEWIKKKKRNSSVFYGFDTSYYGTLINTPYYSSAFGLEGFVGIRQSIMGNISVSLESHAGFSYINLPTQLTSSSGGNKNDSILVSSTQPLFGVYLSYHL